MPRIPQYNQQTSAPVQFRDSGNVVAGQTGKLLGSIARTTGDVAEQQRAITMRNEDLIQRAQEESDRETERTQRLQAKEWADKQAADLELRKMDAFNRLQSSIGADQDFAQEWENIRSTMDDEANKATPTTNPYYGEQLRWNLEAQRGKYGAQAINQKFRMVEENAAMNFNSLVEAKRKALMQRPGPDADAELASFVEELKANASLAQIDQVRADGLEKKAREEASETVLQNMVKNPQDSRTLISAIEGVEMIRYQRKKGAIYGGKPSLKVAGGRWDSQISSAGEKYGVPATLIAATMKQESGGNANAVSPVGAIGLMQLMPGTAKELGVDPTKPDQNIEGGVRYLSQQLERFGNEAKALAAYNAGPDSVSKAIAKAENAGKPQDWLSFMPEETRKYVPSILKRAGIHGEGGADYEAVREPVAQLNVVKTASPDQLSRYLNVARGVIEQDARARTEATKLEVSERERAEKAAAADGVRLGKYLTIDDYVAAGYNPKDAQIKFMVQENFQRMAPVVADLKNRSKAERDAMVMAAAPKNTGEAGIDYDAKRDAWKVMNAANEEIDRQVREDPAGYAIRSNPLIENAWRGWNAAIPESDENPTVNKAGALDNYVAQVEGFQRAQGVETPGILPKSQVEAIKSQWYGQEDGPMKAAQTMTQLAQTYGKHYPKILKQLSKDLPSEALWVGNLADAPGTEGVRQQLAAASKVFAKPDQIPKRSAIEKEIEAKFANFTGSLTATDPVGGTESWSQLRDGAVKLAALKAVQSGASPSEAAKQAYDELVASQYVFSSTNRAVATTMSDGTTLSTVVAPAMIRIPRTWPGQAPGQMPESILRGADLWKSRVVPSLEILTPAGKSAGVHMADVKSRSGWVTSPDDDGLILMLGSAPVRTKDGKPVKISWNDAATAGAPLPSTERFTKSANPLSRGVSGIVEDISSIPGKIGNWFISPSR